MNYIIEKKIGKVKLTDANNLVKDLTDMEELEYWENRLKRLNIPHIIAYTEVETKVYYHVFAKTGRGSVFR